MTVTVNNMVDIDNELKKAAVVSDSARLLNSNFAGPVKCSQPVRPVSPESEKNFERIFFHDLVNMAGVVDGFSEIIAEAETLDEAKASAADVRRAARSMVDAIRHYRLMRDAETGALRVEIKPVNVSRLVTDISASLGELNRPAGKKLNLDCPAQLVMETDAVLLRRVLLNMLSNAFEAESAGEAVDFTVREMAGFVIFSVINSAVIPDELRRNLFQPDNSSKGHGHGLGLYSMKLLAEQYLGGKIGYVSVKGAGTVFMAEFPQRDFVKSCA